MARAWFGGGAADFVYRPSQGGYVRTVAATLTFWTDHVGGTQHTDLLLDGTPTSTITVADNGQVPEFQGPDGVIKLWADAGGPRVQLDAAVSSEDVAMTLIDGSPSSAFRVQQDARFAGKFALRAHLDIRDFGVIPAHPVDDGTDLPVAGLVDWTAEITTALAAAKAEKLPLYFPAGVYGATQLEIPAGVVIFGDGVRGLFERTGSTVLKQLGTDVGDFIRFESFELALFPGVFFLGFGSGIRHMTIVGPQAGTIGNGIAFTTADGTPCTGVTSDILQDLAITGFGESGIYMPDGTTPGALRNVIAYANRLYGLDYQTIDPNHNIALHLDDFHGDGNGIALVRLKGLSNRGTVLITNMKSEKIRNKFFGTAPTADNPMQDHALIIEDCDQTKIVVNGLNHYSSHSTKGPEAAIRILGPDQPRLVYQGVETRLLASQTTGTDNAISNAVTGQNISKSYGTEGSVGTNMFRRQAGITRMVPNAYDSNVTEVWDSGRMAWLDSTATARTVLQLDHVNNIIKLGSLSETAVIPAYYHASGASSHRFYVSQVERFRIDTTEVRSYRDFAIDDGKNLKLGSTTGTKIGTAATEKLAFYGATPIVRPASTPAAATDLATALTLVNDLRAKLLALGVIA